MEWGGETEWQNRLQSVLVYLIWVCVRFCLSVSVGTMALLRCWESQAPWCLACWTEVSQGTFGWIRWPICPFQVWLLHSGASNMNLEAIKDGWITSCPLPHPPPLHTKTVQASGCWALNYKTTSTVQTELWSHYSAQSFQAWEFSFSPTSQGLKM